MKKKNFVKNVFDGEIFSCVRELSKVVANHLKLNFHLDDDLAVFHSDNAADHLGNNDRVPQISPDALRLLHVLSFLLGLSEVLDQRHLPAFQSAGDTARDLSMNHFQKQLLRFHQHPPPG